MKYFFFYIFSLLLLIGCRPDAEKFEIPALINSQYNDTLDQVDFKAKILTGVFPEFVGKYNFTKNLDINPSNRDSTFWNDFIDDYRSVSIGDSVDVNGFELIVDYKTTIYYNRYVSYGHSKTLLSYYPVYFVNSTNSDKIFLGKDSYTFGIQEARLNEKYSDWHPIESRGYDFCGNGTFGIIVKPNEFVLILMKKYTGTYKAPMRVRFKQNESIYVSKPFYGFIDTAQFTIEDSSYVQDELRKNYGKAVSRLFYGAEPDEKEWLKNN
ncbi:MAG: hypothetical protein COB15_11890 [Flavobacteriales bacterium]|nr:MAG: hypothetical protein COB15_11890 [Flavobacteriales bacterium]